MERRDLQDDDEPMAAIGRAEAKAARRLETVAHRLPGGETRAPQLAMTRAVARAIDGDRHLVVQAGTGTGKSLAYLVPAVLSRRRVVVATATKALQDQLAEKDLPLLAASLPRSFSFAVLKGRSNYLCRQRAAEIGGTAVQQHLGEATAPEGGGTGEGGGGGRLATELRRLLDWADTTESGDRADLSFEPAERSWAAVSVGPRECPGAFRCPSGGDCFAERARAAAAEADVVVVNTHLYGSHLASGGMVLPAHEVVVFDEAHELEEVMTSALGTEITPGRLRALAGLGRPLVVDPTADRAGDVSAVADDLERQLTERLGRRVLEDDDDPLADLLALATARVERLVAQLGPAQESGDDTGRRARALSAAGHLAEDLSRLAGRGADDVAWVDGTARSPVLRLSPIDVAPLLAEVLWPAVTAVLTSATMPVRLAERLGLASAETDELDVGSPFDYRTHALLYVARHLPDRRRPESEAALHVELEALITAAGGRTLGLFTSRRATEAAAAALAPRLDVELLVQGQLPKGRLLATFAEEETSCLFATLGFWQGVDVPGRSLTLVTLDRLPFARPDDPVLQARRDRAGDAAFRLVDIPRAATLLAQGVGRLIRSADDRGVVAVLDPRLATAGYRGVLLAGLPPMRRTTDRRQVVDFLARALDGVDVASAPDTPAPDPPAPDTPAVVPAQ